MENGEWRMENAECRMQNGQTASDWMPPNNNNIVIIVVLLHDRFATGALGLGNMTWGAWGAMGSHAATQVSFAHVA